MVWQESESDIAPYEYDKKEEEKKVKKTVLKDERMKLARELVSDNVKVRPDPKPKKPVTVFDSKIGSIKK